VLLRYEPGRGVHRDLPLALDPASGDRLVEATDLRLRYVSRATSTDTLEVAFFADDGLSLNGIDLRVTGGDDYGLSQRWSGAIHAHHPVVDGILDASRHHNGLYCVALFERARTRVTFDRPRWGVLGDPGSPDLYGETAALLRRFHIQINSSFGAGRAVRLYSRPQTGSGDPVTAALTDLLRASTALWPHIRAPHHDAIVPWSRTARLMGPSASGWVRPPTREGGCHAPPGTTANTEESDALACPAAPPTGDCGRGYLPAMRAASRYSHGRPLAARRLCPIPAGRRIWRAPTGCLVAAPLLGLRRQHGRQRTRGAHRSSRAANRLAERASTPRLAPQAAGCSGLTTPVHDPSPAGASARTVTLAFMTATTSSRAPTQGDCS